MPGQRRRRYLDSATHHRWSGQLLERPRREVTCVLGETHVHVEGLLVHLGRQQVRLGRLCGLKLKPGEQLLFAPAPGSGTAYPIILSAPRHATAGKAFTVKAFYFKGKARTPLAGVKVTDGGAPPTARRRDRRPRPRPARSRWSPRARATSAGRGDRHRHPSTRRARACRPSPPSVAALAIALACGGCGLGPGRAAPRASASRSRACSAAARSTTVSRGKVPGSETVMRMLERSFNVSTRYGGGFVESIDGHSAPSGARQRLVLLRQRRRRRAQGAATTAVHAGDQIWWDLHDWSATDRSRRSSARSPSRSPRHRRQALPDDAGVRAPTWRACQQVTRPERRPRPRLQPAARHRVGAGHAGRGGRTWNEIHAELAGRAVGHGPGAQRGVCALLRPRRRCAAAAGPQRPGCAHAGRGRRTDRGHRGHVLGADLADHRHRPRRRAPRPPGRSRPGAARPFRLAVNGASGCRSRCRARR